ncbi:MAG: hypothetical protein NT094_01995 [Candidatus Staskawiczbacteria bacterium]|nr:hypothetical protein [Candidatus Staskawiczbacteria bacterium]
MNKKYIFLSAILSSLIIIALFDFVGIGSAEEQGQQIDYQIVSCSGTTGIIHTGDTVIWTATTNGYEPTYSWTGNDDLSGNGATKSMVYTTPGEKIASVTVTALGRSVDASCSITVVASSSQTVAYPALKVTCSALPSADGLVGAEPTSQTVSKTYTTKGKKTASVTVTSNSISKKSSDCSVVKSNETGDIACIGTAVSTRETTIAGAITAYTSAINTAYTQRGIGLAGAYTYPTIAQAKGAAKIIWDAFKADKLLATTNFKTARTTAWKTYITQGNACKAPSGTGDGKYSGYEIAGK